METACQRIPPLLLFSFKFEMDFPDTGGKKKREEEKGGDVRRRLLPDFLYMGIVLCDE